MEQGNLSGTRARLRMLLAFGCRAWMDCMVAFQPPGGFWSLIESFRPEVIYAKPGPVRPTRLEECLARRLRAPVVPYFEDDWPSQVYRNSVLDYLPRLVLKKAVRKLLSRAPFGLAISPAMAREYSELYGLPFHSIMNCVSVSNEWQELPSSRKRGSAFLLIYVGGVHMQRFESLMDVAKVLQRLHHEGHHVRLVCYDLRADESQVKSLVSTGIVEVNAALSDRDAQAHLQSASALVYVEPFSGKAASFLRLSLSTKLPLYLASGRPILAYGPSSLASMQYLRDEEAAFVVCERSQEALERQLRLLLNGGPEVNRLARNAWEVARANHEAEAQRDRLRELLLGASSMKVWAR
jgi:glycosyltransferase involved in cell wall biosynthesis